LVGFIGKQGLHISCEKLTIESLIFLTKFGRVFPQLSPSAASATVSSWFQFLCGTSEKAGCPEQLSDGEQKTGPQLAKQL
jgi:hypothetical protein